MAIGIGEYLSVTRRPAEILTSRNSENEAIKKSSFLNRAFADLGAIRLDLSPNEDGPVNFERLLADPPGVMVTWARLAEGFERIGLSVVALGPVSTSKRLIEHTLIFSAIIDDPSRAPALISRAAAAQRQAGALLNRVTDAPRVLYIVPRAGRRWQIVGGMSDLLADAHAIDLESYGRGGALLDAERLMALAPDVVLIGGLASDDAPLQFMSRPELQAVPAVRARRVYRTPPGVTNYMMSVIELPIYARWLAEVMHPGEIPAGVRGLARRIYAAEFGVVPSEAELDLALATHANRASAYPVRFGSFGH